MYYESSESKRARPPSEFDALGICSGMQPGLDRSWTDRPWSDRIERDMEGRSDPAVGRRVLRWMVIALVLGFVGLVSVTSGPPSPHGTATYTD